MHLRLWPDEVEALRMDARDTVARQMAAINVVYTFDHARAAGRDARVRAQRAAVAATYRSSPHVVERRIDDVRCLVAEPPGGGRASAIYLHFHGGGMIIGAPEMSTLDNVALARQFGLAVVSVDYRLAPEHAYPAGPDDGLVVARWLIEHGSEVFGTDRIMIGGESAGAYMAAAVLLRIRDDLGAHALARVVGANLVYGVYDWGHSPSQRGLRPHSGPDVLDPEGIEFFTECSLRGMTCEERRSPAVSPAFADLRGMPPALFSVGSCDHLLDDTLMLAARWAAVADVELFVAPEMPHGFQLYPCRASDAWAARQQVWLAHQLTIGTARSRPDGSESSQ